VSRTHEELIAAPIRASDAAVLRIACALCLALAAAGQLELIAANPIGWLGFGLYAAALLIFIFALRRVETHTLPMVIGTRPPQAMPPRLTLLVTAFAFSFLTVQGVLNPIKTPELGLAMLVMWVLSIGTYSFSVAQLSGWTARLDLRAWWQAHWRMALVTFLFGAAAFGLRVYDLAWHPYAFINDEGELGKEAGHVLAGEHTNFFDVGWASEPILAFFPAAASIKLLGHTVFAVRVVSALQGTFAVALLYLLGREMFDPVIGALAATVLLALPLHLHFSRLGVNNVGDAFFSTLVAWLVFRAIRRGTPGAYLLAGLATGSALYTYLGSRLAIALVAGLLVYVALRCAGYGRRHAGLLLIFAGAAAIVALPIAVYFIKTPEHFYARLNAEGIFNNGSLRQQAEAGRGYLGVLWEQFSRSTLVYVARPAIASFFYSPVAYLTPFASIFFVLGLGYAIWRLGDPRYMMLFAWFWAVVIFGSTLTVGPPSSQRLLMSTPPLALLVAVGLRKTASLLQQGLVIKPRFVSALCGLAAAAMAVQGIVFYFGEYRAGHYFENPSNEFSHEVALKMGALGPSYRTFLLGEPSVFSRFADFAYLAPDVQIVDYNTVTKATFTALPRDRGAFFVAVPSRVADLRLVEQWAPQGTWQMVPRRYLAPEPAYFAYVVPPQAFGQP
jgi:dolichyl-phosphate-mannose-protein mannosyltransferase